MTRLHEGPMREILAEVAVGELEPGEMLPREVDLVQRFRVSRGVVRECIRGLEERGVVKVTHGRGARVTSPQDWDVLDLDVLKALLMATDGDELIDEALECQRVLEVEAAALAASRAQHADLDRLTQTVDRLEAELSSGGRTPGAVERRLEADRDFHRAIVQASGNRALARMSAPLHRALMEVAATRASATGLKRRLEEQRRIVAAIAAGDADMARQEMAEHLAAGARQLRRAARNR